jgi:2-haloacid dehalogenase
VFDAYGHEATDEVAAAVMGRFGELKPDPGAAEGCEALAGAGWRMLVLTNGSESLARTLLSRSGLDRHMSAVLSCESISVAKPHWRVYEYGATHAHGQPWMVASHPWDLYGAAQAGMRTALVGSTAPPLFPAPDAAGADIAGAARAMIDASGP